MTEKEEKDMHLSRAVEISSTVKTMMSLTMQMKEPGRKVCQKGTVEAREGVTTINNHVQCKDQ